MRAYRKHYRTSWNETILGLTRSADGRFRPIGRSTPAWSGADEAKAIHQFRRWQANQAQGGATAAELDEASGIHHGPTLEGKIYWTKYFHDLLVRDPRHAAIELDDERLARLNELGERLPSLTLAEIGQAYLNKQPPLSKNWKRQSRQFWDEFCAVVKAETVRDVSPEDMSRYGDAILAAGKSPTYVAHRFGAIKSIFAFALKRGRDTEQLNRVLTLCKMLTPPRKNGTDPKPISPEHFAALLDAAPITFKAVFLLSLNAALYPSEVAAVKKSHIRDGCLVMDRNKTGAVRIAVLWQRAIDAIAAYQAEQPHESEYLFVGRTGQPWDGNHMSRHFRGIRAAAKTADDKPLPDTLEFAHIRDGAYSAAIQAGADITQARLVAGHSVGGISDAYIRRNPQMVADACRAIERHYFG